MSALIPPGGLADALVRQGADMRQFDDLSLGSLELFCLTAELESFTAAAAATGLTPPAVSRTVACPAAPLPRCPAAPRVPGAWPAPPTAQPGRHRHQPRVPIEAPLARGQSASISSGTGDPSWTAFPRTGNTP
jgi:hypothetical protein